jgi:hypothetical protein
VVAAVIGKVFHPALVELPIQLVDASVHRSWC